LPVDVRARAEALAFAGEDDRAGVTDVRDGLGELGDQRRLEGVAALGPRESDTHDVSVSLDR
jgi:hypothetical protein